MVENLRSLFKEDYVQRMFYGFLFIFWVVLNVMESISNITFDNSAGGDQNSNYVYYYWMFVLPCTFLFFQVISNSKLGWTLVFYSIIGYILFSLYNFVGNLRENGHLYIAQDYILAVGFYLTLFAVVFFIWVARPFEKEKASPQ